MALAILRMLTLAAFVLMPFGMTGTAANAQSMPAGHSAMAMDHCEEQPEPGKAPVSKIDCTAMCTALPAKDFPALETVLKPNAPCTAAIVVQFAGFEPEIATPPPRLG